MTLNIWLSIFRRKVINRKDLKELTAKTLQDNQKTVPCSPLFCYMKKETAKPSLHPLQPLPALLLKCLLEVPTWEAGRSCEGQVLAQQPEGRQAAFSTRGFLCHLNIFPFLCDYKQTGFLVRWRSRVYLICHWAASLLTSFSFLFLFRSVTSAFLFHNENIYINVKLLTFKATISFPISL